MSRSGYKLIELLVAMLIMAILTAMKSVWNAQCGPAAGAGGQVSGSGQG